MNGLDALLAIGVGFLAATPVGDNTLINRSNECLAMNMYHEARNQGTAGVLAVTAVVLNRVHDDRFPDTICEVVEQGPTRSSWKDPTIRYPIKNRCQFSWYCDGISDTHIPKRNTNIFSGCQQEFYLRKSPLLILLMGQPFTMQIMCHPPGRRQKQKLLKFKTIFFISGNENDKF